MTTPIHGKGRPTHFAKNTTRKDVVFSEVVSTAATCALAAAVRKLAIGATAVEVIYTVGNSTIKERIEF
jgi:hypothetical protein